MLETERLILRRWQESDAETLFEYARDPDVGPAAGWPAHQNVEESLYVIRNVLSGPEAYALCLKENGRPVGTIELMLNEGAGKIPHKDECELGFWLGKPYWGQGLMPEAVRAMLRHAFEDLGMEKVWCAWYDGNRKSRRVQEKCGFRYQWTVDEVDVPLMHEKRTDHVNLLTREQWIRDAGSPCPETGAEERLSIHLGKLDPEEYIGFLKTTNLGSQYPQERFEQRIKTLVNNVSISLSARDQSGRIVGILLGLTDFAYWLYVTDLGVSRDHEGQGIGRRLMRAAHLIAGGEKDIAVYLIANSDAVPFYEKLGMKKSVDVMEYDHIEWTSFTVE
ncbi:MAG: GNAT family N-acetyltransferase [Anaerolineaceae bacterium]|nr:GNAT family N-acetyltransferase [Anaerolineaceae bacterium]